MARKVNLVWKHQDWTWTATHYQGHGIFYGKVQSPYVPDGEYGTWYLWEIQNVGANLVVGTNDDVEKLLSKQAKKDMEFQKQAMSITSEENESEKIAIDDHFEQVAEHPLRQGDD